VCWREAQREKGKVLFVVPGEALVWQVVAMLRRVEAISNGQWSRADQGANDFASILMRLVFHCSTLMLLVLYCPTVMLVSHCSILMLLVFHRPLLRPPVVRPGVSPTRTYTTTSS
jgi:hypothetical protein